MRAACVVELDPVSDGASGVLDALEAMAVSTLLLQRPNQSLGRAILLRGKALDDGSGLVFPGTKAGRALSDMTLSKLFKELGFAADVHGFRTSFRTWAQERTSYPREVAEAALAHLTGDAVERAYARSDVFEKRRKMMGAWAAYLADKHGNVVRIG